MNNLSRTANERNTVAARVSRVAAKRWSEMQARYAVVSKELFRLRTLFQNIRHVDAQRGRQVVLVLLFLGNDFPDLLS